MRDGQEIPNVLAPVRKTGSTMGSIRASGKPYPENLSLRIVRTATPSHPGQDTALRRKIFQAIRENGSASISFADFMAMCLYDSAHGYYASSAARPIGREGDFYTSVSVGAGYGFFLALAIGQRWRDDFGGETPLQIIEQGAHDGRLALDIVAGLRERGGPLAEPGAIHYLIHESDPARRRELENRLATDLSTSGISVVSEVPETPAQVGIFLCNELLDAFPVHRVRWESGGWRERRVGHGDGETFRWVSADIPPGSPLAVEVSGIDSSGFPKDTPPSCASNWMPGWPECRDGSIAEEFGGSSTTALKNPIFSPPNGGREPCGATATTGRRTTPSKPWASPTSRPM
jgi:hypothetical protein